jgi:molecular chaperone IbpA
MRHVDFSPFYRSTVGFDRLFTMLDSLGQPEQTKSYPPYNIERTADDAYTITMAVAGFAEDELDVEARENTLTIRGEKAASDEQDEATYLHRSIATRAFERRFQLAEHMHIHGANLKNGLLYIDLLREVPEEKKLRKIAISAASNVASDTKQIEEAKA